MSVPAPFAEFCTTVQPEWVDHNGHMGIRSYTHVFDAGVTQFYRFLGLTRDALRARGHTIFALQETSWFRREVMLDDPLLITSQLVDCDHNKIVTFHHLRQTRDDYVAALYEIIEIQIDMEQRKPAPFPDETYQHLEAVRAAHEKLGRPPESGQGVGIKRKSG